MPSTSTSQELRDNVNRRIAALRSKGGYVTAHEVAEALAEIVHEVRYYGSRNFKETQRNSAHLLRFMWATGAVLLAFVLFEAALGVGELRQAARTQHTQHLTTLAQAEIDVYIRKQAAEQKASLQSLQAQTRSFQHAIQDNRYQITLRGCLEDNRRNGAFVRVLQRFTPPAQRRGHGYAEVLLFLDALDPLHRNCQAYSKGLVSVAPVTAPPSKITPRPPKRLG